MRLGHFLLFKMCVVFPVAADDELRGPPDYANLTGEVEGADLPTSEPVVLWKAAGYKLQDRTPNVSDCVIADGAIFFGDDEGTISSYGISDHSFRWAHNHGKRISTAPSIDADHVYFGSEVGIVAVNRFNASKSWEFEIAGGASECTPIPIGDKVYVAGYDGCCYALDQKTGGKIWRHDFMVDAPADKEGEFNGKQARLGDLPARPNGSASDGELFIQCIFDQSRVIALDCQTGERKWSFQAEGWISPAPTIANGRVYVSSQDHHLYSLDWNSGELVWKYKAPSWLASQVAVHEGSVYLPHHGAKLLQIDIGSGELVRTFEPQEEADRKGNVYSTPIIANETAYFASGNGTVWAYSLESGDLRWKLTPSANSELFTEPQTDGKLIFVSSRPGERGGESAVFAIGTK